MSDQPPVAERIDHTIELHGRPWSDDYHWLRNREDPKVVSYLEAENEFTSAVMAPTKALQKTLYDELLGRIKEDDRTVPYKKDDYFYYSRTAPKKAYRIYCRRKGSIDAREEVILDVNELAEGKPYMSLGALAVSPNHEVLAYAVDESGAERHDLRFKRIETGEHFDESIRDTSYSLAFANDGTTVFYTVVDDNTRPYQVWRHVLGTAASDDVLVMEEPDERFFVDVDKTRSRQFILIGMDSAVTSEVHVIDADDPTSKPRLFAARRQGIEYGVEHSGDRFFVLTNEEALDFKLMQTPLDRTEPEHWRPVIEARDDVTLLDVEAFAEHLIVTERHAGLPKIWVHPLDDRPRFEVEFEEAAYDVWIGANAEFRTSKIRFGYTSLTQPTATYDYDLVTRQKYLLKEREVLGYDKTKYVSSRFMAKAPDGVAVPISLVHRRDLDRSRPSRMLLEGYGAYGSSYEPTFSSNRVSLLDRGFVVAIAHVRGGGDMGRRWKEGGKLANKQNTFSDFIACAEHLISTGYTSSERLGIAGRSAGGLLIGAVINQRPELFGAAIAGVPFVDVVNTMLDETIPLTAIEWEEWGNPKVREDFERIVRYSPYDNVRAQDYPHLLVLAGLNDPRVQYWEPAKWTAKLRATESGTNVLLLKTNMGAGHGGASGRYGRLEEAAFEHAFLLTYLD